MKYNEVAVVSDVMMSQGGAERVVETFLEMWPGAELFTLVISDMARKKIERMFPKVLIHTSVFQWLPDNWRTGKYLSIIKLVSWVYWEWLDLSKYELIISSSHSFGSKNVKKKPGAFHLAYVHTSPRYLYAENNEIGFIKEWPWNWLLWPVISWLRTIDKKGSMRPDMLVANSENVAARIKKYYGRDSRVVYPPVEVARITNKNKGYFVCLSRLVKQKGIELAIRTCVKNNLKLIVIGNGPELNKLKKIAKGKVRFVVNADDEQKCQLLSGAKALIYTSINEDLGMVPVEALMLGVPVVGFNSGGTKETVVDGKNGVLFDDFDESCLMLAIKRLSKLKIKKSDCKESVKRFSKESFILNINKIINDQ